MDFATGAIGALIPKLGKLLKQEYDLQKGVKEKIMFLMRELESMQAVLEMVSDVPVDELDKNTMLWAREVRELSYDIEDIVDTFLVHVEGKKPATTHSSSGFIDSAISLLSRIGNISYSFVTRSNIGRKIAIDINDVMNRLRAVKDRRERYRIDSVRASPTATSVDPRLPALYKKVTELIGIDKSRDQLIRMLNEGDNTSKQKLKRVSVVGVGGLGKTTLAKAVYDHMRAEFECCAFVSVGQNPDVKKVLKDIMLQLDQQSHNHVHNLIRDEKQLIDLVLEFLGNKRYLIVVDDVWDIQSWEVIKLALAVNNRGNRIITTTRNFDVAMVAGDVYRLEPLCDDDAKILFFTRIFYNEGKSLDNHLQEKINMKWESIPEVANKILNKCGGIPLAIITVACLLADKPMDIWYEVYNLIGFNHMDNKHIDNTMKILSFSYYDLPSHLRTCLLYLSAFPEDYIIEKKYLIWMWIAEGFIHEVQGMGTFEVGERYFTDLMNRSMIQLTIRDNSTGKVSACQVHDMVLALSRSISVKENFFTILDNEWSTLSHNNKVRRLSQVKKLLENQEAKAGMTHVRSFIAFSCQVGHKMFPLSSFHVLRVFVLENCSFHEGCGLMHLGDLPHLRCLRLADTNIRELPKDIGALKYLQNLELVRTGIKELPLSIGLLTQLARLHCPYPTIMPGGIVGKLTSLQDVDIYLGSSNRISAMNILIELCNLTELKELCLACGVFDEGMVEAMAQSLHNWQMLRVLKILNGSYGSVAKRERVLEFVISRQLQFLTLANIEFSRMPMWINSSLLPNLSHLFIDVKSLDYEDISVLGRLAELCCLHLQTRSKVILNGGAGYFCKLRSLWLKTCQAPVMFRQKKSEARVLPSLEYLHLCVHVHECKLLCIRHGQGMLFLPMMLGLHNISNFLEKIVVEIHYEGATTMEVNQTEDAIRNVADAHPKHPTLQMTRLDAHEIITTTDQDQQPSIDKIFEFHVHVHELNDMRYAFDFTNLMDLPLLENVMAHINCEEATASEVNEAEAMLSSAVDAHPNHPALVMERYAEEKIGLPCQQGQQLVASSDVVGTMKGKEAAGNIAGTSIAAEA